MPRITQGQEAKNPRLEEATPRFCLAYCLSAWLGSGSTRGSSHSMSRTLASYL